MTQSPLVYFVDDEEELRNAGRQTLELADIAIETFDSAASVLRRVSKQSPAVIVTDIRMAEIDGIELMKQAHAIDPDLPVILVTGHGDVDLAVRSMQDGAYDFIEKPYSPARLVDTIRRAQDKRALTLEVRALRNDTSGDPVAHLVLGRSDAAVNLRRQLRANSQTESDVLIQGDTGTGKRIAAQAIHSASRRSNRPFLEINCAALPEAMVESELFGHEVGAFPGAMRERYGRFEHARGGTVLLDEIDSLTLPLQAKLLHAIQSRRITRLGSNEPVEIDVRFIATTKRNLEKDVDAGHFRADLFYLLSVSAIQIPDLQSRREDIPLLFSHFATKVSKRYNQEPSPILPELLARLALKTWPGNVRELENAAERFALGLDLLDDPSAADLKDENTLAEQVAAFEKSVIATAITSNGGSLKATYEALGLSRKTLYEKMQKHGLSRQIRDGDSD